jgi:hypothetical protein
MEFWVNLGFEPRVVQLTTSVRDLRERLASG